MIQEVRGHFNINSIKNKLQKYYKCKICSNSKLKKKKKKKKKKFVTPQKKKKKKKKKKKTV